MKLLTTLLVLLLVGCAGPHVEECVSGHDELSIHVFGAADRQLYYERIEWVCDERRLTPTDQHYRNITPTGQQGALQRVFSAG